MLFRVSTTLLDTLWSVKKWFKPVHRVSRSVLCDCFATSDSVCKGACVVSKRNTAPVFYSIRNIFFASRFAHYSMGAHFSFGISDTLLGVFIQICGLESEMDRLRFPNGRHLYVARVSGNPATQPSAKGIWRRLRRWKL